MNGPDRFNSVVETLLADRSPAAQARCLGVTEQRMLLLAQRIRGSREHGYLPHIFKRVGSKFWDHPLARGKRSSL
jgi:hypothetical protein